MNRHAVDRAVRRLRKAGWVETQTKRTIFGPTLHYRIDETKFWAWMESKDE
jgi:DNA-binding transcriptional regulator YhcF (GntR family)